MLVIRYLRAGKKNQPSFKIVVTDKRKPPRGGRFVEILGFYNPLTKKKNVKKDRVLYWISKGAKPSTTVHNLLVGEKIIEAKKVNVSKKKKLKEGEKVVQTATPEKPKELPKEEKPIIVETPKPAVPEAPKEEAKPAAPAALETPKAPAKDQAASAEEQKA